MTLRFWQCDGQAFTNGELTAVAFNHGQSAQFMREHNTAVRVAIVAKELRTLFANMGERIQAFGLIEPDLYAVLVAHLEAYDKATEES